jgi:tRNA (guanine37-N1)-methyltransferase
VVKIKVLTIFPELFPGPLGVSVIGRALSNKLWSLEVINMRDFAIDSRVDNAPIGGGSGLVMRPDVISDAIEHALAGEQAPIFYLSPRGKLLTQSGLHDFAGLESFILICGRFEGIDQRVIDHYQIQEISIGNYVLAGGEAAAFVLIEGCIRLLPGVLGNDNSSIEESFAQGGAYENLVEYPQYTKPNVWQGHAVPDVLFTGNHKNVADWRLQQARAYTEKHRSDLKNLDSGCK